ncbi:uncharacterized protein LOC112535876 [Ricinus communis]|uniref:Uncharacterized protein n=1 Tax=Ricinus communis TaxID=3988 RepID=B9SJU3_RICCO|nr:uncharacterized protein LOC112535876 [Ricinus communis]EEF36131.1 conserved hypothetical protein [Ricinus communis]|eukprot:XP_025014387.1 uncharacterized protein LOC112535876 [Ricinus communis]
MAPTLSIKTLLLLSLLLLIPFSSGMVEGFREGMNPNHSLHKDVFQMINTRKLLMNMLDYDDTGPNTKHDPRKKGGKP